MPMDARLTTAQKTAVYNAARAAAAAYTNIPGNNPYHYSWHQNSVIVVGYGAGPGNHRNFTCAIDNAFGVALAPGGGGIPLGDIDQDELLRSVTNVLRTRLRALIQTAAFNNIGRSAQQLTFHTNELVNRHTNNSVRINTTTIDHGATANFANNVTTTGFIVFRNFAGTETYYRNYDIRETADAAADERLKVLENPVKLEGSVTQNYNIALL